MWYLNALQEVWEQCLDLFDPIIDTMQQCMWQGDLIRSAHYVLACFEWSQTLGGGQMYLIKPCR